MRTAAATDAALASVGAARNGSAQSDPTTGNTYWWLRSPGMFSYNTAYVNYTGSIRLDGVESPTGTLIGVRALRMGKCSGIGDQRYFRCPHARFDYVVSAGRDRCRC